jgi:integral membrane protein
VDQKVDSGGEATEGVKPLVDAHDTGIWNDESMNLTEPSTPSARNPTSERVTPRSFYRTVAIAESITWTLLIVGMLLKYVAGLGTLPVLIGGSIHGFVFITYALTAVLIGVNQRWTIPQIVFAVVTAIVPYATIPFDIWLVRKGKLDGDWHREESDDPRDNGWIRRLLRWLINHPAILIALFSVGIVVIMSTLLLIGPPGGWGDQ